MKIKLEDKHIKWGFTAFLVIIASIVALFLLFSLKDVVGYINNIVDIIMPFIYGLVFAYVMCPVYNKVMKISYDFFSKNHVTSKRPYLLSKVLSTFVSVLILIIIIVGFLWMVIPSLVDSLLGMARELPARMDDLSAWIDNIASNSSRLQQFSVGLEDKLNELIDGLVKKILSLQYLDIAQSVSSSIWDILTFMTDVLVGLVICVYFLASKDIFVAQSKKVVLAIFSESKSKEIFDGFAFTHKTFGGFINGKLLDSLIVGILCFVFMSVVGWPYPLLISCIIGVTNIIPFFGPFIGAVPSVIIMLTIDPKLALYFLIFIIVLQQIDGNIIGPKILGNTTGLSSFWVMFAIVVGGGLFGFAGMIIGIPVFAVLYAYIARSINIRLRNKGHHVDTSHYRPDRAKLER